MTAQEMVEKFRIELVGENIRIMNEQEARKGNNLSLIRNAKPEIVVFLKEQQKAQWDALKNKAAERQKKIDSIEGLKEIRDAIDDIDKWFAEFEKSFDDVGGLGVRAKPQYDFDALYAKYPQAKAYLDAEELKLMSNYELSSIGDEAMEMVLNGEWEKAVTYMQEKRKAFVDEHIWN